MENNNRQTYNYTVLLEKEQDGGYHAFCPILKGCHSQGDTFEEAIENITEAIQLYIESLMADNQPIPKEDLIVKPLIILLAKSEEQATGDRHSIINGKCRATLAYCMHWLVSREYR